MKRQRRASLYRNPIKTLKELGLEKESDIVDEFRLIAQGKSKLHAEERRLVIHAYMQVANQWAREINDIDSNVLVRFQNWMMRVSGKQSDTARTILSVFALAIFVSLVSVALTAIALKIMY